MRFSWFSLIEAEELTSSLIGKIFYDVLWRPWSY